MKTNLAVADGFQAAVGDGDTEDITIVEDLFPAPRMLRATSGMKTLGSEVLHEFIERIGQRVANFSRQMGVDLRCPRAAVTQILLNDAEVDSGFQ